MRLAGVGAPADRPLAGFEFIRGETLRKLVLTGLCSQIVPASVNELGEAQKIAKASVRMVLAND